MATASSLGGKGVLNAYDAIAASATDSVLVAAKAGMKIRVTAFLFNHGDTTASTVTFNTKGSGAGTACYPVLKGAPNAAVGAVCDDGLFETIAGQGLTVTTGAGSTTSVSVVCRLVPG